jgi:hypothetical protein
MQPFISPTDTYPAANSRREQRFDCAVIIVMLLTPLAWIVAAFFWV